MVSLFCDLIIRHPEQLHIPFWDILFKESANCVLANSSDNNSNGNENNNNNKNTKHKSLNTLVPIDCVTYTGKISATSKRFKNKARISPSDADAFNAEIHNNRIKKHKLQKTPHRPLRTSNGASTLPSSKKLKKKSRKEKTGEC